MDELAILSRCPLFAGLETDDVDMICDIVLNRKEI